MERRNILLIGKTGDGKSSAGNTILCKNVFTPNAAANSATAAAVKGHGLVHGREITVIDTPGFFDTDQDDIKTKSAITKALIDTPELHAIVLVLQVGRYTRHENEVVEEFLGLMKEERVLKHTAILFTFGEQLEDQTLNEFIKSNSKLQELIKKCEGRCHVIDNKYWNDCHLGEKSNRVQVNNLLDTIDKMVQKNGCFTSELLQAVDEMVQEEIKMINNLPPEEKQEKAKKIVHEKILELFAGATTGALIGAFLGVFVVGVTLFEIPLKALLKSMGASAGRAAAVEVVAAGEAAAVETGAVAEGAGAVGAGVGTVTSYCVLGAAAIGAAGGAITGWKAAEEADSVYDAMKKAAEANYENAKTVVEKLHELGNLVGNNKM